MNLEPLLLHICTVFYDTVPKQHHDIIVEHLTTTTTERIRIQVLYKYSVRNLC